MSTNRRTLTNGEVIAGLRRRSVKIAPDDPTSASWLDVAAERIAHLTAPAVKANPDVEVLTPAQLSGYRPRGRDNGTT